MFELRWSLMCFFTVFHTYGTILLLLIAMSFTSQSRRRIHAAGRTEWALLCQCLGRRHFPGTWPLVKNDGRLTAEKYGEIIGHDMLPFLLNGPFPDGLFILQRDNCPVHTSRHVKETLEDLCIPQLPWPTKFPDLNTIENVWGIMKRNLSKRQLHHSSQEELWEAVCEEWDKLRESPELCPTL